MRGLLLGLACAFGIAQMGLACTSDYSVKQGDTLSSIAHAQLGDASRWSQVFYNNSGVASDRAAPLVAGTTLKLPCEPETVPEVTQDGAEITLITGSNYAPFTDLDWPGQGMLTELVNAAFEQSPDPVPYKIVWDDTWANHMPRLQAKDFDMGFPWFQPNCAATGNTDDRCARFHFSDPLVDLVIVLFARTEDEFTFEQDADLVGRTLCRPTGYFTHDLDRPDRQWLSKGLITLRQPDTPDDCFDMLMRGEVDAVALNEFLGVSKMFEMGLTDTVVPLQRPLSTQGLHVIISKTHWRGTAHLYRFNAGLAKLKQSDRYTEIVSRHLAMFWDQIKG